MTGMDREGQGASSKRRPMSNAEHSNATKTNSNPNASTSFSVNVAVQTQLLRLAQTEHAHVAQRIKALETAANCNAQEVAHADSNLATLATALAEAKAKAAEARATHAKNDAVLAFLTEQQSGLSAKIDKLVASIGHQLPRELLAESGDELNAELSHQSSNASIHQTERKRRERTTSPCSESSDQQSNSKKRGASSSPIMENQEIKTSAYLINTNTVAQAPKLPCDVNFPQGKNDSGRSPKPLLAATTSSKLTTPKVLGAVLQPSSNRNSVTKTPCFSVKAVLSTKQFCSAYQHAENAYNSCKLPNCSRSHECARCGDSRHITISCPLNVTNIVRDYLTARRSKFPDESINHRSAQSNSGPENKASHPFRDSYDYQHPVQQQQQSDNRIDWDTAVAAEDSFFPRHRYSRPALPADGSHPAPTGEVEFFQGSNSFSAHGAKSGNLIRAGESQRDFKTIHGGVESPLSVLPSARINGIQYQQPALGGHFYHQQRNQPHQQHVDQGYQHHSHYEGNRVDSMESSNYMRGGLVGGRHQQKGVSENDTCGIPNRGAVEPGNSAGQGAGLSRSLMYQQVYMQPHQQNGRMWM
ncbi:hypothetical protein BJ741DRAFT_685323 [Chytriomyces cf. hyalinus JEL632]|nr:hypothetical protein BJ741DRAFT_685323 [Chytriomyces cf. hyalinus JEL632]